MSTHQRDEAFLRQTLAHQLAYMTSFPEAAFSMDSSTTVNQNKL